MSNPREWWIFCGERYDMIWADKPDDYYKAINVIEKSAYDTVVTMLKNIVEAHENSEPLLGPIIDAQNWLKDNT